MSTTETTVSANGVSRTLARKFSRSVKRGTMVRGAPNVTTGYKVSALAGTSVNYGKWVLVTYEGGSGYLAGQAWSVEKQDAMLAEYAAVLEAAGYKVETVGSGRYGAHLVVSKA